MFQDIRFGIRRVFGPATFSLSVIIIIAAGVGVAGAMASVLNALAFRSVAFPNASELVAVSTTDGITMAVSVLVLLVTGVMAAALPAARAVRVDPATAVRAE